MKMIIAWAVTAAAWIAFGFMVGATIAQAL